MVALSACLFKLEALAPHQQQSDDIAEIHACRFSLRFQTPEAVEQDLVVDPQSTALLHGRHAAEPKTEGSRRRPVPGLGAVVLPDELAGFVDQHTVELF